MRTEVDKERALEERADQAASLTAQVEALVRAQAELREELLDAHEQLLRRDDAFRSWDREIERREDEIRLRDKEIQKLLGELARLKETVSEMEATRVWRLGQRYWHLRDLVFGWLGIRR